MGRNEIRLRETLHHGSINRHRDYDALMKRHKRSKLFRRTIRFFLYSLLVTVVVLLLIAVSYYVIQLKKNEEQPLEKRQADQGVRPASPARGE